MPFFTHASAVERLRGVVAALRDSRYDLVLFNVESPVHRDEHFAALTGRDRADGLLVMSLPPPPRELERARGRAACPIVLVDAVGDGVPCVVTDDVEGGRIATRHLVELGHREIAFIGDTPDNAFGFTSSAKRRAGLRGGAPRRGHPRPPQLRPPRPARARDAPGGWPTELLGLTRAADGVFAASDVQAIGVLEAARAAGLRVPEDLSVVGFDDIEISAYVGLTTVRQPLFDSGYLGAQLLLDALEGRGHVPRRRTTCRSSSSSDRRPAPPRRSLARG